MQTLYFYDLETSGVNPREARVMQFAGQRTGLNLEPIGEPHNIIIRLSEEVVPDPDAILITGITPQQTHEEGISEAEFLTTFAHEIATPDTIFVGFNTIRFDDEFMRYMHYRNFYDPYAWQWRDGRSRWDLLDLVRMTRALRPDGLQWPFDPSGKPTNRLELLTAVNNLSHVGAHDALSDVRATISLAQLLRTKQPKLFDYLLNRRTKEAVKNFVQSNDMFIYSSGKYANEFEKTTVVTRIADHPKKNGVLVYDLRFDPAQFLDMSTDKLAKAWEWKPADSEEPRLPIKLMQFNRCPAIAPIGVLDESSKKRLSIDLDVIERNRAILRSNTVWPKRLFEALDILDKAQQGRLLSDQKNVDAQLYDGFFDDHDRDISNRILTADAEKLLTFQNTFHDDRLNQLLLLYQARNFPKSLTDTQRSEWEKVVHARLFDGGEKSKIARYFQRIDELEESKRLTKKQKILLEDLRLYGQSLLPTD